MAQNIMPIAFRVIYLNLYLRDTHILGIREAAMTHIAHGASIAASCYAGATMWRWVYRKSDYDWTTEKPTSGTVDALAEWFYRFPGSCHLRNRDERGVV
jgi:hypothetical protein